MRTFVLLLVVLTMGAAGAQPPRFQVIRQWKYVNFTWPDEDALRRAQARGLYVPENNIISGVKHHEGHFYLTLSRFKGGVPATLTRILAGTLGRATPLLEPYPSWQMNEVGNCENLQNVQNVEIDTAGQIWIIDVGRVLVETAGNPVVVCPPKLVIFDIVLNRTNMVYTFPEHVASKNSSYLYDIVLDNTDGGYAYITDNGLDPGIIVFSAKLNRSWKIRNSRSMRADPIATQFNVNGIFISTPLNLAGIALGPKLRTNNDRLVINDVRDVYFCPVSSVHLYSINTSILREEKYSQNYDLDPVITEIGQKASQTAGMIMDNMGVLYYGLLGADSIARWDSYESFQSTQSVIARDDIFLEWPNSFTLDINGNLTVVTNRLDRFLSGQIDLNQYNFRLITAHVGERSYLYDSKFNYEMPLPNRTSTPQTTPNQTYHSHDYDHLHDDEHNHIHVIPNITIIKSAGDTHKSKLFAAIILVISSVIV